MAIPNYQTLMLPVIKYISDGNEHTLRETISALSDEFSLTDKERKLLLPSGTQPVINNRVAWAVTYLRQAGLLKNLKRGVFKITERGRRILADHPDRLAVSGIRTFRGVISRAAIHAGIRYVPGPVPVAFSGDAGGRHDGGCGD